MTGEKLEKCKASVSAHKILLFATSDVFSETLFSKINVVEFSLMQN